MTSNYKIYKHIISFNVNSVLRIIIRKWRKSLKNGIKKPDLIKNQALSILYYKTNYILIK